MRGAARGVARSRIGRPSCRGVKPIRPRWPSSEVLLDPTAEWQARAPMFIPPNSDFADRPSQSRSYRNDCASGSTTRSGRGLCTSDRRLAANEEPPLGAHLITPRFAYAHHGIYVGGEAVVHYAAFASHWRRGPVEEVSLARFAHGHAVWVRSAGGDALRCEEIVRRAHSRLGENRYRLLSNNCEHFSEWCVHGKPISPQAERFTARLRCVSDALSELMR